jgi:ubiquinone/menaquinone biosynthesis C-methylase UbiE
MIKYYGPNPKIIAHIEHICNDKTKVLELGPGLTPFSKATHFCGWDQGTQKIDSNQHTVCDFSIQKLPYADKEFDFIYCRHVLEDLYNPFLLVEEMSRVGKAGYIETPSPAAELCKNIDCGDSYAPWRGYHHHNSFVWEHEGTLCFVKKFPIIEHIFKLDEEGVVKYLEEYPHSWNTYMVWKDTIPYKHFQHDVDFKITTTYGEFLIKNVLQQSIASNNNFYNNISLLP